MHCSLCSTRVLWVDASKRYLPDPVAESVLRELGSSVATWRKLHQLTQVQLATRAGVSRPVITRLERGDQGVGIGALVRVLTVFGVEDDLLAAIDPYQSRFGRQLAQRAEVQRVRRGKR